MGFNESNAKKEYELIVKRGEELKERIQHMLLSEDYDDWKELLEVISMRHNIELKMSYEKGIKKGAYYQRVLDCKESD